MDRSNGYEGVATEFLARRGSGRSIGIGVHEVREWARTLPNGAAVIDLGCGPGFPITEVLVAEGLDVFAIDAAPSFVQAFRRNLPNTPVVCEAVQDSTFFHPTFEGVCLGAPVFAVPRRPTTLDPKHRRHISAGWPATLYIHCGTLGVERCNDGIGITLPWSRRVSETALSGWPVCNE